VLIIVQRYQRVLHERLRRERKTATVLFDRRYAERRCRETEPYTGIERRRGQRRRAWTSEERAVWSEFRFLTVFSGDAAGAAPWTVEGEGR
jgi:hypothetical protein